MRIWTLWGRERAGARPVLYSALDEVTLASYGMPLEYAWRVMVQVATDEHFLAETFTRVIDVADASILNDTDASVVGAVVPESVLVRGEDLPGYPQ